MEFRCYSQIRLIQRPLVEPPIETICPISRPLCCPGDPSASSLLVDTASEELSWIKSFLIFGLGCVGGFGCGWGCGCWCVRVDSGLPRGLGDCRYSNPKFVLELLSGQSLGTVQNNATLKPNHAAIARCVFFDALPLRFRTARGGRVWAKI